MQSTNLFCWNLTSKESRSRWFRRPDKVKGECANSIPLAGCIFADIWAIQKRPYEIETGLYPSRGRTENYLDWLEMSGSRYDGGRSFRSCRGIIFRKIRKEASALVKQISTICVQDEVIRPFQHSSESEMAIHVLERNTKAHFHLLKCEDGITCQKSRLSMIFLNSACEIRSLYIELFNIGLGLKSKLNRRLYIDILVY